MFNRQLKEIKPYKTIALSFLLFVFFVYPTQAEADLTLLNQPNSHLIIRHALAPGTGDRCLETAEFIDMGAVNDLELLNSVWIKPNSLKKKRTKGLIQMLSELPEGKTLLLVTHYANILALTGRTTGSGEGFIIQIEDGDVEILGEYE